MNVSLTPQLEALVQAKVASGRYTSASEVVREALRVLEEYEEVRRLRLAELQRRVAAGLDELDRGEGATYGEGTSDELAAEIKANARRRRE